MTKRAKLIALVTLDTIAALMAATWTCDNWTESIYVDRPKQTRTEDTERIKDENEHGKMR